MSNNKYIVEYNNFLEKETTSFDIAIWTLLKGIDLKTFWDIPFICSVKLNGDTIIQTNWLNIEFWKDLIEEFKEDLQNIKTKSKFTSSELVEIENNLNNLY